MKLFFKQLFRNIGMSIGQFLSILLVIALGSYFFTGMNEATHAIGTSMDDYYQETKLADATGTFAVVSDYGVERASAVSGGVAQGRYVINTHMKYKGAKSDVTLVTATDEVNLPYMRAGRAPETQYECIVDTTFAEANGIGVGATVEVFNPVVKRIGLVTEDGSADFSKLNLDGYSVEYSKESDADARTLRLTVTGLFTSPEYVYKVDTASSASKADEFAVVVVPYEAVKVAADSVPFYLNDQPAPFYVGDTRGVGMFNQILVRDTDMTPDQIFAEFSEPLIDTENVRFAVYVPQLSFTRADGISEKSFRSAYKQIGSLASVVPTLFFIVAAIILVISMTKTVDNERTQIAVMQAVGRSKGAICGVYVCYALTAALFGSLLGGLGGLYSLPYVYEFIFNMQYVMPPVRVVMGTFLPISIAVSCAVAALAALWSCVKILRQVPAEGMRPKKQKVGRSVFLERFGFFDKLGFGTKMVVRNVLRNKLRILLSSVGVIGSMMLLMLGLGLYDRIGAAKSSYEETIGYDYCVTLDQALSPEALNGFEAFDAAAAPTYSVTVTFDGKTSDSMQVTALPAETETIRLYDGNRQRLTFAEDSLFLPQYLAKELGVGVGDEVTLSGAYGQVKAAVTGISVQYLMPAVYCGYQTYLGLAPATTTTLYVMGGDRAALEAVEGVKRVYTAKEMSLRAIDTAGVLEIAVAIFVLGAAVLGLTVIYNITSINISERAREIATLLVLGYKRGETSRMIIAENIIVTILGVLIGLPLGYAMFFWAAGVVSSLNIAIPTNLTWSVALGSIGLAFVFSMAATLLLLRKVLKIDMVEALKGVE